MVLFTELPYRLRINHHRRHRPPPPLQAVPGQSAPPATSPVYSGAWFHRCFRGSDRTRCTATSPPPPDGHAPAPQPVRRAAWGRTPGGDTGELRGTHRNATPRGWRPPWPPGSIRTGRTSKQAGLGALSVPLFIAFCLRPLARSVSCLEIPASLRLVSPGRSPGQSPPLHRRFVSPGNSRRQVRSQTCLSVCVLTCRTLFPGTAAKTQAFKMRGTDLMPMFRHERRYLLQLLATLQVSAALAPSVTNGHTEPETSREQGDQRAPLMVPANLGDPRLDQRFNRFSRVTVP